MSSAVHHHWKLDQPIVALAINGKGDLATFALGDGRMGWLSLSAEAIEPKLIAAHDGVSLSLVADADGLGFLSGGDDGRVLIIEPEVGSITEIAAQRNQWIDHVAASVEGLRAYSSGKKLVLLDDSGAVRGEATLPSSIGGLSFSPNGKRLAASHYNGLSLFWTSAKDFAPQELAWKGSHLKAIWHPDGKTVLTTMQDCALHGWRLSDMKEMRMQGYAAKIRSWGFSARGKYLLTSGAAQAICWPFTGGGPWGKQPLTLGGETDKLVTEVAPHPRDEMAAIGYEDGMLALAPLDGRMEIIIHPPTGSPVEGLVWNAAGDTLLAALGNGTLLLFTMDSVRKMVRPG